MQCSVHVTAQSSGVAMAVSQGAVSKEVHCRVFTTHEQLAVAEEKQAELAGEAQQAKQAAVVAEQALAASQAVHAQALPTQVTHNYHLSVCWNC